MPRVSKHEKTYISGFHRLRLDQNTTRSHLHALQIRKRSNQKTNTYTRPVFTRNRTDHFIHCGKNSGTFRISSRLQTGYNCSLPKHNFIINTSLAGPSHLSPDKLPDRPQKKIIKLKQLYFFQNSF